jgi:hypothetical protein
MGWRGVLIGATLLAAWWGMQAVHELGHLLAGWLTGAAVLGVELHPLRLSRTALGTNPHPLAVTWAGPLLGVTMPLAGWAAAALLRWRGAFLLRFWAGFCLVANGVYLGLGWMDRVGDCGDLLREGAPVALLIASGLVAVPGGLLLWHGQGAHFGLGREARPVPRRLALSVAAAAAALAVLGLIITP